MRDEQQRIASPTTWDTAPLALASAIADRIDSLPPELASVRFPFRLLRYWFVQQLIKEAGPWHTPLTVCEVGIDRGQMLRFMQLASHADDLPKWDRWDGIDIDPSTQRLRQLGFSHIDIADLETPAFSLRRVYDVVIALHVLEHCSDPEPCLARLAAGVRPGGILVGGMPVTVDSARRWWERRIRRTARPHGHHSVFSPERLREAAIDAGLQVELLSGAFLMRRKGFVLENFRWWLRLNLAFGHAFPGWPGEMYFLLRKPQRHCEIPAATSF